ncbi:MAG: heavy metal translocating P-type ATPase [Methanothrix sp.]|uniref:heavy metal translocating P-type ATPase n=1 Tax=Methanothrix sp. TaxID=90426 RepID=UPI0025CC6FEB|nr:heavy metal translocating P-type ATPase [Methanothrix sp.]MCQ8902767.1 heavy metal translocating P-type ATPase [Methanothrix sp.]
MRKRAEIRISGMTCATCASTIESALREKGVESASVNLGSETALVEYDPARLKLSELESAIRDAGYDVINERATVKVGGMVCATCESTVADAIREIDGVSDVTVNLGTEKAYVTYNPRVVSLEDIRRAIEGAGYQYLGVVGEESESLEAEIRARDLRERMRKIIVGFGASALLMALMYLAPMTHTMSIVMMCVATPAFVYVGSGIFRAAHRALRNRNLNMDVMYSMGTGVAFVSSVLSTFGVLSHDFIFYETAVMLASFLNLGRYLETRAKWRTSDAIKKLVALQPRTATLIVDGSEKEIPAEMIKPGDIILIRPGDRVPADGEIIDGEGYVDESMISGEPLPVLKKPGSQVIGGTLNKNAALKMRAMRVGRETFLAQIIDLVDKAQGSRPEIQRLADRVVSVFIPIVLSIAMLSFLAWYFLGRSYLPEDRILMFSLSSMISVLVVACPCALGLATPTAVTVGIGRGAELGILIKSGEALEVSDKLTTVVFDKTGTLTVGRPEVTEIMGDEQMLRLAASVESRSEHPLGEAIVRRAISEGVDIPEVRDFYAFPGMGVFGRVDGLEVAVGNRSFISERGTRIPDDMLGRARALEELGQTVLFVSVAGAAAGAVAISDAIKDSAKAAVEKLRGMGLDVVMITGDNIRSARSVAEQIGIEEVHAEVLPQEKASEVRKLQEAGKTVAFVGDGINDAPALAQADLGIAIGSGTDVAIEAGEIVLIRDDLMDVVRGIQLSRKVMSRIKQNIFWAFAYNSALIPVAAGVLYPGFGIVFRPELAGLAMALSSVTVVSLSLMLKRYIPDAQN